MKRFKGITYVILFFLVALVSIIRTVNQLVTLVTARRENAKLENSIKDLEYENKILERKIQEASGSAFGEQVMRDKFGLGTEDDYWIILPEGKNFEELYPKVNLGDRKANWQQWLELFTD